MNAASRPELLEVEIWIPSQVSRISPLVERIMRVLQLTGCAPGKEVDVEIALREALNNAVQHGNQCDPKKPVYVTCRFELGGAVSLIVRDEGQGFDPRKIPDAPTAKAIESEHGWGILLMKFYMDEVCFEKGGTEFHMRKKSTRKRGLALQSESHRFPTFCERTRDRIPHRVSADHTWPAGKVKTC